MLDSADYISMTARRNGIDLPAEGVNLFLGNHPAATMVAQGDRYDQMNAQRRESDQRMQREKLRQIQQTTGQMINRDWMGGRK